MKALIIGAGVCGPVTAMALQKAGIDSIVYEAHPPTPEDLGSYLTVATNGLAALAAIDAEVPVMGAGFPTPWTVLVSGTGKHLGTVPIGRTRENPLSHTIKRAHLHRALHREATGRGLEIEFGKKLVAAAATSRGIEARFDDGSEARGDLLIGCDGVHSVTRKMIDPLAPDPRYVGLLNFGGYTERVMVAEPGRWHMIFGRRAFFGYVTDTAGGTVWFANVPRYPTSRSERESTTSGQWQRWLVDLFADDDGPARRLVEEGRLELAGDNTHDLPSVPTWHRDSMIIIGDAAHAPSPSSGQGASMAIEDAVVLAQCLRDSPDVPHAFAMFERLRRQRVERIVAFGARNSSNKAVGAVGRVLRDAMLPWVFRYFVTEKSVEWLYEHQVDWDAPIAIADERRSA